MRRVLAVVVVLALTGCAVPSSTSVGVPSYSPVREALAWFPREAPLVAVTRTDPQDPGLRRLAAAGVLEPLRRAAAAEGLRLEQWSGLLGEAAVVGQPYVGGPPLAVLATDEPELLEALAGARVAGDHARPAGAYRGAELYAEDGWAFAVRDRVLVVSETTGDLLAALDTRAGDASFDASQLNAVQPSTSPPATFLRAYVDLEALVAQTGPQWRSVPLLAALDTGGVAVGATAEALDGIVTASVAVSGLTPDELPGLTGRAALPATDQSALAVADLGALATAAEDALRRAAPVSALKLDALRSAGVPLQAELLAGPAVITRTPALRLEPLRPAALSTGLARAARRLNLKLRDGFFRFRGVNAGFVEGTFVAGRTTTQALGRLARAPLVPQPGPVALRVPRLAGWLPPAAVVGLSGSLERLTLRVSSSF